MAASPELAERKLTRAPILDKNKSYFNSAENPVTYKLQSEQFDNKFQDKEKDIENGVYSKINNCTNARYGKQLIFNGVASKLFSIGTS